MKRIRTCGLAVALLAGLLLAGCTVPEVKRADVVGLWKHRSDSTQTVEIRGDGTFLIRNVSLSALNGKSPVPSAPYQQGGTWTLERFYESPHRYYVLLLGTNSEQRGFAYTFPVVGSGSGTTLYLPLGGRYEGRRFEFARALPAAAEHRENVADQSDR